MVHKNLSFRQKSGRTEGVFFLKNYKKRDIV